jgi:uncharacterized protein (TIGR03435 family)
MVDLIRYAYGTDPDKIIGGPNWLEMDRFDITAKLPPDTNADNRKLMLQGLLKERFHLVTHPDSKPMPQNFLIVGKKPQLKQAEGTEESGCKPQQAAGAPAEGGIRLTTMGPNGGAPMTINLGPGMTVQYSCRNISMAGFVSGLRTMMFANLGTNPVIDETGLKGNWNFDLRFSVSMFGPMNSTGDRVTLPEAIEKQLGLKLEERQVPTPVMVVDSANKNPTPNPAGTAEAIPPVALPTEFEVATIKLATGDMRMSRYSMQPGGRVVAEGMPLRFLLSRAFNTNNNDQIVNVPQFAQTDRYDINAKVASGGPAIGPMDMDAVAPMLLALLKERFKLTYHTEERPMTTYALVASKPKMKKADPASRAFCKNMPPQPGGPPAQRILKCQNVTMEQFAERLQGMSPDMQWPVADTTELAGTWDFSLAFSMRPMMVGPGGGRGAPMGEGGGASAVPTASEPAEGYTIFEAIEKQLGLKLEKQKKNMPVYVIDHMESKPIEN